MDIQEFYDEQWEELILFQLEENVDLNIELWDILMEELIMETEKIALEVNILNLFKSSPEEIKLFKDKALSRYYTILAKATASIILFNDWEYYEYSQDIYNKLQDLYALVTTGYDDNNVEDSISPFVDVFNRSMQLVSNTEEFKNRR